MKRFILLLALGFVLGPAFAQKFNYYTRDVTKNGELQELIDPILIDLNLLVGNVIIKENGVEVKTKLNPEDIVYSGETKSSQVVVWEILSDVGPHKIVVYNYDRVAEERELCIMLGKKKDCYLNIFEFQKGN